MEFFKCKTIHSRLLCIDVLYTVLLRWVINIVVIYNIMRYTCRITFAANFHWTTKIIIFLLYFILNYHGTLIFSLISNLFFCCIFEQSKKSIIFDFWSTTKSAVTKLLLTKPSDHWDTEHCRGSADHAEVDIDSGVNCMASSNLWQYTTVPNQCEQFPWTWMWRLLYFYHWSHF